MSDEERQRFGVAFKIRTDDNIGEMPLDMFEQHIKAARLAMQRHLARKYSFAARDEDIFVSANDNKIKLTWYHNPDTYDKDSGFTKVFEGTLSEIINEFGVSEQETENGNT